MAQRTREKTRRRGGCTERFSIVIPTYNEEKDILRTLEAIARLRYPKDRMEIVIVDDSTDETPRVIRKFAAHHPQLRLRLLTQKKKEGRTGARNLGIRKAKGDILVILNADVHLPPDFLSRIAAHYARGADYVLVESKVQNTESVLARYLDAQARHDYQDDDSIEWTEGFSCRKRALMDAGLFPNGFIVPLCAGEDGPIGERLRAKGYRKVIDRSIVVPHIAPSALREYWHQQVGRGKGITQVKHFLRGKSLGSIALFLLLKTPFIVLRSLTIVYPLISVQRIARCSSRNASQDFWRFLPVYFLQTAAYLVGEWAALLEIQRAYRRKRA